MSKARAATSGGDHDPTPSAWSRLWPWFTIVGIAVVALVFGFIGFSRQALMQGLDDSSLDLAYKTFQLFFLESGYVQGATPWQLEIARALAPIVPAWAALQALGMLFREQREAFWLRRRKGHVVICGLGRKGMQLVRDFLAEGEDVVVIESDEDNPRLATCRFLGAKILIGNSTDTLVLKRARVDHASSVIAVSGSDGTNVETAINVYHLVQARPEKVRSLVTCYIQVVDLQLGWLLEQHDLLSSPEEFFKARVFNGFQNCARSLLERFPLEPPCFAVDDPRGVHLIVVGFGKMGQSVALQAAKLCHMANGKQLRITVIDRQADSLQESFTNRHPQLEQVCDLTYLAGDEESPEIRKALLSWAQDENALTSIAVCLDGDSASLTCALTIMSTLRSRALPVFVRMAEAYGLATLLDNRLGGGQWDGKVHAFGMTEFNVTSKLLLNRERETLAQAFHEDYVAKRLAEGKPATRPNMREWSSLSWDLQDSNFQGADHLPVKLRAIGCRAESLGQGTAVGEFDPEEIEVMARMEHARWYAERSIAGWRPGPTDHEEKVSVSLVDWDELPDDVREYDRQMVRCIPAVLALIGQQVVRDQAPARD